MGFAVEYEIVSGTPDATGVYEWVIESPQAGAWRQRVALLKHVQSCRIELDQGEHVRSWRWELELVTSQRKARVRPLFTFQAVAKARRDHDN